ncbi:MAG: VOC family protein [Burkholderiaceae bacterium]|nr:VOC family protein [Ottowia sp.]
MQLVPYLTFNGNCREAFTFYQQLFNGKILYLGTFGEMPDAPPMPEAARNAVMHVNLQIGAQQLMGSDAMPGAGEECAGGYVRPQGMNMSIGVESEAEGRRIFDALAEGGTVTMPFGKTFWSPGFGMLKDRFGTPWMVNVAEPA